MIKKETMQKYIQQTHALDNERSELIKELANDGISDHRSEEILKRLEEIYQVLALNAIILADFLSEFTED